MASGAWRFTERSELLWRSSAPYCTGSLQKPQMQLGVFMRRANASLLPKAGCRSKWSGCITLLDRASVTSSELKGVGCCPN